MITYLKRRFSSGDLQGEAADKREQEGLPSFLRFGSSAAASIPSQPQQPNQTFQASSLQQQQQQQQQQYPFRAQDPQQPPGMQPNVVGGITATGSMGSGTGDAPGRMGPRGRGAYPSAPTSPTRSYGSSHIGSVGGGGGGSTSVSGTGMGSLIGPMGSITGQISSTIMRGFSTAASTAQSMATGKSSTTKERQKILLVIDDSQTDWSKYFRGRKILSDWDIRVEQAQYSEITMTAYSDHGCVINIYHGSSRTKPIRTFKPDFVLLRQHASGANEDWQPILTGLMYSGTPCLNTLHAVYNMKNRQWLFAHLLLLRNRLGKETFPLINQVYYTSHKEMITAPAFPTIVKIGLGHGGEGKIRADNPLTYQDITSLLVAGNLYATTEPFIDAKCDLHVQKIGPHYKAFVRKSITGNWKSNMGSSILEKIPMTERFKQWIDEVSRMFGGLDICSVEALQNKAGEYFIYDANGSDMALFGDSQEDDRREIAELVLQRMYTACQQSSMTKTSSLQSMGHGMDSERSTFTTPQPSSSNISQAPQAMPVRHISTPQTSQSYQHTTTSMPQQQQQQAAPAPVLPPPQQQQTQFQQQNTFAGHTGPQPTMTQQYQSQQQQQSQFQQSHQQQIQQSHQQQQQPYRPMPSGSASAPLPPKFGSPAQPVPQADQGSVSSFSSSSSVFSGISSKTDGGQNTPIGHRDEGPTMYGSSALLSNQTGGMSGFATRTPSVQSQQAQFTTTATNAIGGSSAWAAQTSAPGQTEPFNQLAQGGLSGVGSGSGVASAVNMISSSGSVADSTDSMGRRFTGTGSNLTTSPPISGAGTYKQQTQTDCSLQDSSSMGATNRPYVPPRQTSLRTGQGSEDADDTMKNLRKTFAGIFGDM